MNDQELIYTMAITRLMPLNAVNQRTLLNELGSATAVYENRHELGKMMTHFSPRAADIIASMESELSRCEQELEYARTHKIKVLAIHDEENYPSRLRQCEDAPLILFHLGNGNLNANHLVSVVGTRHCSERGRDLCNRLAADLARLQPDVMVVSGLAYGIDIAAHRACLNNGLATTAVLAHGLDEIYPRLHRQTAIEMLERGGLVTEYMSHTQIEKVNFVQRNRIVAGIADATIVIESPERGGSLITAEMASGYHREVFAFPGRPSDVASVGCNRLIRNNAARLITSAEDLLVDLGWEPITQNDGQRALAFENNAEENTCSPQPITANSTRFSPEEQSIITALSSAEGDLSFSELIIKTALPVAQLTSLLMSLEIKNTIKKLAGNRYHVTR